MSASIVVPVVVSGLSVRFDTRPVLQDLDLVAAPGRRIGLVGENGSGKSTLLRAVAGRLPARAVVSGGVEAPGDLVMLGQEPPFGDGETVERVLGQALQPLRRLVAEVERLAAEVDDPQAAAAYAVALEHARRA
jgi:macrolide transport system ATP-binding/permease protein